jgi:hypothetical protein
LETDTYRQKDGKFRIVSQSRNEKVNHRLSLILIAAGGPAANALSKTVAGDQMR